VIALGNLSGSGSASAVQFSYQALNEVAYMLLFMRTYIYRYYE